MPGMVVRCEVSEGTIVAAGDGLLILEAMKMENEIRAARNGTVKKLLVRDRQVVDKGELLLIIE
jgi:pyruvate carboxylase subunit B